MCRCELRRGRMRREGGGKPRNTRLAVGGVHGAASSQMHAHGVRRRRRAGPLEEPAPAPAAIHGCRSCASATACACGLRVAAGACSHNTQGCSSHVGAAAVVCACTGRQPRRARRCSSMRAHGEDVHTLAHSSSGRAWWRCRREEWARARGRASGARTSRLRRWLLDAMRTPAHAAHRRRRAHVRHSCNARWSEWRRS